MKAIVMGNAPFAVIAASVVFVHAPESQPSLPKLAARTIVTVENNIRKLPQFRYDIEKCVRAYTIEMVDGVAVGRGVIVAPGRGFGFPSDVERPNINPRLLKPGYYIVRPEQMPIWPVSYFASDVGMYAIRFDPRTGTLFDDF